MIALLPVALLLILAESHLTRGLFGTMLRRIWALPVPTGLRGTSAMKLPGKERTQGWGGV